MSVESARWLGRIDALRTVPAAVRFLSCEPLLSALPLDRPGRLDGIDWIIAGGESGPGARPMRREWALDILNACRQAGIPFFFKQWGEHDRKGRRVGKKQAGRRLEGREWNGMPRT